MECQLAVNDVKKGREKSEIKVNASAIIVSSKDIQWMAEH